jgi:hypothetical protein
MSAATCLYRNWWAFGQEHEEVETNKSYYYSFLHCALQYDFAPSLRTDLITYDEIRQTKYD